VIHDREERLRRRIAWNKLKSLVYPCVYGLKIISAFPSG